MEKEHAEEADEAKKGNDCHLNDPASDDTQELTASPDSVAAIFNG
ncbi:hypothetical protein [Peribacillus sp. SCS-155]